MIKKAWVSFILLGILLGSSAMFNIMYNEPLTDYSVAGIMNYTSILYNLTDSIFGAIVNLIINVLMPIITVIQNAVIVIQELFSWLADGLGSVISFFTGWWN